ncbi:extracellular serine proteinase-like [Zophobas morio]|uniref:extracellular serine proteinase-like n=1 Tax=Zophobas morio TaxID=2755281 RepID=UPI0030839340
MSWSLQPYSVVMLLIAQVFIQKHSMTKSLRYEYTGKGIEVYVVDTGLNDKALDNKVLSRQSFNGNGNFEDEDGHGTHVAGIIGSQDYGVAKGVLFHNLKVLDEHGDGKESPMIAAIEFAINLSRKRGKKSIINLSFSAGNQSHSRIFDGAILEAVNAGLIVIAAAGNDNVDACSVSPGGFVDKT